MGFTSSNSRRFRMNLFLHKLEFGETYERSLQELMKRERSLQELMKREFEAFFGELGSEKEVEARFSEFMKGGGCKEIFRVLEEAGIGSPKCKEHTSSLVMCVYSHTDYYQPILSMMKTIEDHVVKEVDKSVARKEALRDELRRSK